MHADIPRTPLAPRRAELMACFAADANKENACTTSPALATLRTPAKAPGATPQRGKVRVATAHSARKRVCGARARRAAA